MWPVPEDWNHFKERRNAATRDVKIFDVCGIGFVVYFPTSGGNNYILVAVAWVSKWVKAIAAPTCDARVIAKLFKKVIFPRFGVLRTSISDVRSQFKERHFEALLKKYGVYHKIVSPYHPQTSRHVEISKREIKEILEKTVSISRKDWSFKLDDVLWVHMTAYKIPLGMSPFRLVYGNQCYLLIKLIQKAWWQLRLWISI